MRAVLKIVRMSNNGRCETGLPMMVLKMLLFFGFSGFD